MDRNKQMMKSFACTVLYKLVIIGLFCFLLFFGCKSPKETAESDTLHSRLDSLMNSHIDNGALPGAVLQVKKEGDVLYSKAFGYAHLYDYNLDTLRTPEVMTTDHLFDLASLTKVLGTTMGIMILADKNLIQTDDPLYRYLTEFNQSQKSDITIRHLLTHTAGLYEWQPLYYKASNKIERYHAIAEMPLKYEVGKNRHYSDLGFMLLGDIIEKVSGLSLDRFLIQELYQPLGLKRTAFNPLDKGYDKIAATSHGNPFEKKMVYDDDFGFEVLVSPESWDEWRTYTLVGEVNDGNAWYANNGVAGHAGLFSTVQDIQVLLDLLINRGLFDGQHFISKEIIDNFLTKDGFNNAMGWAMDPKIFSAVNAPGGTFGHTGFTGTSVVVIPEAEISIILLTNRQNKGVTESGYYQDMSAIREEVFEIIKSLNDL